LGYSFLLFFLFFPVLGFILRLFSADSWVRAAVAADGGWAGRATGGGSWGGGGFGGGGGGVVDSEVLAEDRLEAAARAEAGEMRSA